MRCAVNNCGNNNRYSNRSKLRFFHFPREPKLLKKWVDFCERDNINHETACICNEHFSPEDFERNMQPGSYPTGNGPQKLPRKISTRSIGNSSRNKQDPTENPPFLQQKAHSPIRGAVEEPEEECEILAELLEHFDNSSTESEESCKTKDEVHLEVLINDPHNPQTMANDDVEAIVSKDETYVKYLEHEVASLKREVGFLKADRKKLLDEIKILRDSLQS